MALFLDTLTRAQLEHIFMHADREAREDRGGYITGVRQLTRSRLDAWTSAREMRYRQEPEPYDSLAKDYLNTHPLDIFT